MGGFIFTVGDLLSGLNKVTPPKVSGQGYRPPQWNRPQITSLTVKNTNTATPTQTGVGQAGTTTYFFDAVMRADHTQELRSTHHPIQSGASIVDHSYLLPARLVLEIGMSDSMQAFKTGAYTSSSSKSVSAYQKMLEIQALRVPLKIMTRLRIYENMVLENVMAFDDARTRNALKASLYFQEIIVAEVTQNTVSARPNQTSNNKLGTNQPEPVPADLQKYLDKVGKWSSNQSNLVPSN